jgi:hypothetical protein
MGAWPLLRDLIDRSSSRHVQTLAGIVAEWNPEDQDQDGAMHQILIMQVDDLVDVGRGAPRPSQGDLIYVVIRYGDQEGLPEPIPGIVPGDGITARGVFIPADEAYQQSPEGKFGVLHFTHRPLGWVEYRGKRYE